MRYGKCWTLGTLRCNGGGLKLGPLVTVSSDARPLLESVMEDEFVGNRTHGSFTEVQGAGPEQGLCARVYLAVGKEIETARERDLFLQLD